MFTLFFIDFFSSQRVGLQSDHIRPSGALCSYVQFDIPVNETSPNKYFSFDLPLSVALFSSIICQSFNDSFDYHAVVIAELLRLSAPVSVPELISFEFLTYSCKTSQVSVFKQSVITRCWNVSSPR